MQGENDVRLDVLEANVQEVAASAAVRMTSTRAATARLVVAVLAVKFLVPSAPMLWYIL